MPQRQKGMASNIEEVILNCRDCGIRTRGLLFPNQPHTAAGCRLLSPNRASTCANIRLLSPDVARCLCTLARRFGSTIRRPDCGLRQSRTAYEPSRPASTAAGRIPGAIESAASGTGLIRRCGGTRPPPGGLPGCADHPGCLLRRAAGPESRHGQACGLAARARRRSVPAQPAHPG
jgi:hypothetical protein